MTLSETDKTRKNPNSAKPGNSITEFTNYFSGSSSKYEIFTYTKYSHVVKNHCLFSFFLLISATRAQDVSVKEIINTEKIYDLHFSDAKRDSMVNQLNANLQFYRYLHGFNLPNSVPLPNCFEPVLPTMTFSTKQLPINWNIPAGIVMPVDTNQLAFYSIGQLSSLLRQRKITSVQLSRFL